MYTVRAMDTYKGEITDIAIENILNNNLKAGRELVAMAIGSKQLIMVFKEREPNE